MFTNPVAASGPDPYAVYRAGYYFVMWTDATEIVLRRTRDLTRVGDAETRRLFVPVDGVPASHDLWAPELHQIGGRWYVYFTANDDRGDDRGRRIHVLGGPTADDPWVGDYAYLGPLKLPADRYAIDGTVLEARNDHYFIWSTKLDFAGGFWQHLMIARMNDPLTLGDREVVISRPDLPWEIHEQPTNEGPQLLLHGDDIWLGYSGSAYWCRHYAIGFLHAKRTGDLMDPGSWRKMPDPFFTMSEAQGVFGPGHGSFVKSPDGSEDWLLYHARDDAGRGDRRSPRLQPVRWVDGVPDLGTPRGRATPLRLPAGTPAD
ncbi:MAG: family 43 glycosylhydrolase [Planctomycetota bacterium]